MKKEEEVIKHKEDLICTFGIIGGGLVTYLVGRIFEPQIKLYDIIIQCFISFLVIIFIVRPLIYRRKKLTPELIKEQQEWLQKEMNESYKDPDEEISKKSSPEFYSLEEKELIHNLVRKL